MTAEARARVDAFLDGSFRITEFALLPSYGCDPIAEILEALREARAATIELGEALAENERYEVLERVQARCPWLVLFGEEP